MSANISHGRGGKTQPSHYSTYLYLPIGAANIKPDDTPYADGEIIREGPVGNQGDGPYSSGRGGVGNIDQEHGMSSQVGDEDIVPDIATRQTKHEPQHFGRGGAGNLVKPDHDDSHKGSHESFKDKVKDALHIGKKD